MPVNDVEDEEDLRPDECSQISNVLPSALSPDAPTFLPQYPPGYHLPSADVQFAKQFEYFYYLDGNDTNVEQHKFGDVEFGDIETHAIDVNTSDLSPISLTKMLRPMPLTLTNPIPPLTSLSCGMSLETSMTHPMWLFCR